MYLTFRCPQCEAPQQSAELTGGETLACGVCDWKRSLSSDDLDHGRPRLCLMCGNLDLWRQKNFPVGLGVLIVALGAILSSIAWYHYRPAWALGILMVFGLADMLLYAWLPDVLTCYRCGTKHHRCGEIADLPAFNHELGERYRQERLRNEQQRRGT